MADDELAQIRAARLAQLKQQGGSADSGDGQASEQDQKRFVDYACTGQSLILSKEARIRSTNEYP
jgi:DNA-binding TFAR19-related protein (PDSD5 family)